MEATIAPSVDAASSAPPEGGETTPSDSAPRLKPDSAAMEKATAAPVAAAASSAAPDGEKTTPADSAPHLRLDWQEALMHGLDSNKFSVEVHHGGYFVRAGENVSYVDKKSTVWFDNLDRNNFNMDTVNCMIDWLGYEKRKYVFWCPPGKGMDELTEVVLEWHCRRMADASVENKVLVFYIHHPNAEEQEVKDEISHGESAEDSEEDEKFQSDSDEDPAWHDSDYDMKDDDALFEEHVDDSEVDEMVDKGKQKSGQHAYVPGSDDVNEFDLELPMEDDSERRHKSDSDDEEYNKRKKKRQVPYKFKPFNSASDILDARELPVLSMFEKIRSQIQHRHYTKRKEAIEKMEGTITPKIRDKLRKNTEFSRDVEVSPAANKVFGVESHGRDYVVELNLRACSCTRWQLTGIPCSHAIACMRHERIKPESMVSNCYSVATYMQAYGGQIFPLRDKDEWTEVDATPILPPLYEKCAGRRKKNRRKHPEESEDGTRLSKHGVIIHCGYCRKEGHNRSGCSELKAAIIRENSNDPEEEHASHAIALVQQPTLHQNIQESTLRQEEARNTSSRGRKRKQSSKMREHVEQLMEIARKKKSKHIVDENGDIDFPMIRSHIKQQPVREQLDPENLEGSMVHILGQEGEAHGNPLIMEKMPEESSFIAEHRATIPTARGPLVTTSGRALGASARGVRGARGSRGAKGSRGGRREKPQKEQVQDEIQSTQGAPGCQD